MVPAILSIQSWVSYGHVGNAAAVFPLQRLGFEVWAIHTVQFSNHPGYGAFTGRLFEAADIGVLVDGMAAQGALANCDGLLSGYLGDLAVGSEVARTVDRLRDANPRTVFCCDPVIGDAGPGVYVRPGVADIIRDQLVPRADILTPNQFELEWLSGSPVDTLERALTAVDGLRARGPRTVLVTSLRQRETPADAIDMLAVGPDGAFVLTTPLLPISVNGAGDALAALFLGHRLRHGSTRTALENAGSAIHAILAQTAQAGTREIQLIAAQDEIVAPRHRFTARQIR